MKAIDSAVTLVCSECLFEMTCLDSLHVAVNGRVRFECTTSKCSEYQKRYWYKIPTVPLEPVTGDASHSIGQQESALAQHR